MKSVAAHYSGTGGLADRIADQLRGAGKNLADLSTADLAAIDEFHIRGRAATLELAEGMRLTQKSRVLDIGSGLGCPARTLAESFGCHVTGIDLTQAFCDAAEVLSKWVGLETRVAFRCGDATDLPFADGSFDAAMTIHAAMNIAAKDRLYSEARRVARPGGVFAVYDVLQGEGGDVIFPVPWARDPSISFLVTPDEMESLLTSAGFTLVAVRDSTDDSERWFKEMAARIAESGPPSLTFRTFLGEDFPR